MMATKDIRKGEELLICYTGIRWGRDVRRKHLLVTKCFLCCCARCLDPSECGTFISAVACSECAGNMMQKAENDGLDAYWRCSDCVYEIPHKKVLAIEVMIGQMLKIINKKSTNQLEGISRKLTRWLSPHHYILLEIYMSLIALYEQKNENHERVVALCDLVLPILRTLEGESKAVALLNCSKITAQVKLFQSGEKMILPEGWLKEAIIHFDESFSLLKFDVEAPEHLEVLRNVLEKSLLHEGA